MTESLSLLRQHGFSELACQFAAFIARKESAHNALVSLSAGLLTEAITEGHVCLNLRQLPECAAALNAVLPDNAELWITELRNAKSVGRPGDYTPMILTEEGLLYLYRYWLDERDVATAIRSRLHAVDDLDYQRLNQTLAEWNNPIAGVDWQKAAVAMALSRHLAVISGGPGTGKTTIVLKILQCLQQQKADLRIGLAAPTGKAAARLQQSISRHQVVEVKTLHRLLGITEHNDQGRYNAERPLPMDVLIIDEASMIDISLMAKLMRAMPAKARLILLGDSQQLASVESGAVLANLSESEQGAFTSDFVESFPLLGLAANASNSQSALLTNSFVRLQHSYRFDKDSLVGQLAKQVNAGDAETAIQLLSGQETTIWHAPDERSVLQVLISGYQAFIEAIEKKKTPLKVTQAFDQFRVLAALKQGPQSVMSVNRLMTRFLAQKGWRTNQTFYQGRPIMITQNDYRQQLFNGDIGIILRDTDGQLKACFYFGEALRWVGLNRLPAHETVFAMTVHKSQGSEFDAVSILLPEEISPILNRELLYTAITRARKTLSMLATEQALRHTIHSRHQRESGLTAQLSSKN
jgi:exodeoxyribonuclease V alpha subunit